MKSVLGLPHDPSVYYVSAFRDAHTIEVIGPRRAHLDPTTPLHIFSRSQWF
jgi:hypothetical protein